MDKKYYSQFDFIKFFISVVIVVIHYRFVFGYNLFEQNVVLEVIYDYCSYAGVQLFFLLSGFLIYQSYHQKIIEGRISSIQFLGGRIKRIYPMMIATVICMTAAQWICKYIYGYCSILDYDDGRNSFLAVILSIFGLNSGWVCDRDLYSINGVTWYISILMICYGIFYAVTRISKENKKAQNICYTILFIVGFVITLYPMQLPLLYQSNGRGYMDFFLGVLIAQVIDWITEKKYEKFAMLIGVLGSFAYFIRLFSQAFEEMTVVFGLIANISLVLLVVFIPNIEKLTNHKAIKYLGEVSFDIYLWHMPGYAWIRLIDRYFQLNIQYAHGITAVIIIGINVLLAIIAHELHKFIVKQRRIEI